MRARGGALLSRPHECNHAWLGERRGAKANHSGGILERDKPALFDRCQRYAATIVQLDSNTEGAATVLINHVGH